MEVDKLKIKLRNIRNTALAITISPILMGGLVCYTAAIMLYTFFGDDRESYKCKYCAKSFLFNHHEVTYDSKSKLIAVYCPHCFEKNIYRNLNG